MRRTALAALSLAAACGASAKHMSLSETSTPAGAGLCDPNVKQHAGYFDLTTGKADSKHYFYWAYESRNAPATDPLVLWLTGGPGCSSAVAMFAENGPCHVSADGMSTTLNPHSWNSNATMLYVDQPTGTGFSYGTGFDHNETQIAADMYDFLQQFFKAHPEYQALPFFIYGESYAGHYVPAVGHKVFKENAALQEGAVRINLKGISIGNGLTDPATQYPYYADMGVSTNGHDPALSKQQYAIMKGAAPVCVGLINACNKVNDPTGATCLGALTECNLALVLPYQLTNRNPYDMREDCKVPPLCYDFSGITKFLHRADVLAAIGVRAGYPWQSCNRLVTLGMEADWMKSVAPLIPDLLEAGIPVQLYAGDQDFVCNWLGNKAWALKLEWAGKDGFNAAEDADWVSPANGAALAKKREHQGFSFVQVHDAGHMVPMNQPEFALEMLNRFIH